MDSFCIRRTFFDIARAPAVAARSASAPPSPVRDGSEAARASDRYVCELVEKAEEMLCVRDGSSAVSKRGSRRDQPVFFVKTPGSSPQLSATPRPESSPQSSATPRSYYSAESSMTDDEAQKPRHEEPSPPLRLPIDDRATCYSDSSTRMRADGIEVSSHTGTLDTSCPDEDWEENMCSSQSLQEYAAASQYSAGSVWSGQDFNGYRPWSSQGHTERCALRSLVRSRGYKPFVPSAASSNATLDHSQPATPALQPATPPYHSQPATPALQPATPPGNFTEWPLQNPQEPSLLKGPLQNPQEPSLLKEGDTTLMIHDLPYRLTVIDDLMEAVDEYGFAGTYDLVYIPPKQKAMRVKADTGFCFINFKAPADAALFVRKSDEFISGSDQKKISVFRANTQGFAENLKAHLKQCGRLENETSIRIFPN